MHDPYHNGGCALVKVEIAVGLVKGERGQLLTPLNLKSRLRTSHSTN
jgi:hypothetical protein